MTTVAILGAGRAGTALAKSAKAARVRVVAKANRVTTAAKQRRAPWESAALLLVAVPDDALDDVAAALARWPKLPPIVAHTSGVKGPSALAAIARAHPDVVTACFHPLASLDGTGPIPKGTLLAVDVRATTTKQARAAERTLTALARRFGCRPAIVPEEKRALYHAGAVVAGNLPVALLAMGVRLLVDAGVPEELARVSLARLLRSQAENAVARELAKALTGPVARGDERTLARHLAALDASHADVAAVYRTLSRVLVDVAEHDGAGKRRLRAALGGHSARGRRAG